MAHLLKGFSLGAGMCHRGVKVLRKPNSAGMGVGVLSSLSLALTRSVRKASHKGPSWAGAVGWHAVVSPS